MFSIRIIRYQIRIVYSLFIHKRDIILNKVDIRVVPSVNNNVIYCKRNLTPWNVNYSYKYEKLHFLRRTVFYWIISLILPEVYVNKLPMYHNLISLSIFCDPVFLFTTLIAIELRKFTIFSKMEPFQMFTIDWPIILLTCTLQYVTINGTRDRYCKIFSVKWGENWMKKMYTFILRILY